MSIHHHSGSLPQKHMSLFYHKKLLLPQVRDLARAAIGYENRSKAIQDAIRLFVLKEPAQEREGQSSWAHDDALRP